ncbi:Arabinanase/levansucrase/invertase [Tothia fuscella]|uniref:Arabinanase/levansucrase/invertase n=1 Tax=Tothia fuscella TaxID=1048955 RepID=A0A9P4U1Z4_9PEZI|nr:Arabinanase/levansucrase/invertase [Tothia fuscella]
MLSFPLALVATTLFLIHVAVAESFTNPLNRVNGSDPFMVYSKGNYYLTVTGWDHIAITRAKTIEGLKKGERKVVWRDSTPNRCCEVWAPEMHEFDGVWWIYYTAGSKGTFGNQRPHVLKGGATPFDKYTYAAQMSGPQGMQNWGIDATVATIAKKRYFIWSCKPDLQSVCLGEMSSPTRVSSFTRISKPELPFEKKGEFPVNEGPAVMNHGGKTYIAYSASHCASPAYSLGLLTLKNGANPLKPESWIKSPQPVVKSGNGNYGTGHNGFFQGPEGDWWNVYHATKKPGGDCRFDRYTMVSAVKFDAKGDPIFDQPQPSSKQIEGPKGSGP